MRSPRKPRINARTAALVAVLVVSWVVARADIRYIGTAEGLPNATISDMAQDPQGFLWIATKRGLCRFDGQNFISYHTGNSDIAGNELNGLLIDPADPRYIWIATERDGLDRFDTRLQEFHHFSPTPAQSPGERRSGPESPPAPISTASPNITALAAAASGGLWVANYASGIDFLDPGHTRFEHYDARNTRGLPQDEIWCLAEDKRGFLYIGHQHKGLTVLSPREHEARNFRHSPGDDSSLPHDEILSLCIDSRENIWVGTKGGLALFNPQDGTFRNFRHDPADPASLLSDQIYDLACDAKGTLWIACRMGGVSSLDPDEPLHDLARKPHFRNIPAGSRLNELHSIHTRALLPDSFGNIWIGYEGDGIDCLPHLPPLFTLWSNSPGQDKEKTLRGKIALSLLAGKDGTVWVGEDACGIDCFRQGNNRKELSAPVNRLLDNTIVQTIFQDNKGILWFGTYLKGILCYNPGNGHTRFLNPDPQLPIHIRCLYEDNRGNIYAGTHHGLYLYRQADGHFSRPAAMNAAIGDPILRDMSADRAGNLYVATFGNGITRFNPEGKTTGRQNRKQGFPSDAVNTLFSSLQGELWAGTRKGLVLFRNSGGIPDLARYETYDETSGLPETNIQAIEEDAHGNLWFTTDNYLIHFRRKEGIFCTYSQHEGLPAAGFLENASACAADGTLYFAGRGGVVSFRPEAFYQKPAAPRPAFTELIFYEGQGQGGERHIPLPHAAEEVRLSHRQNTFSIRFGIQDYALAGRIEYAYRMENLDKKWYTTEEPSATFRGLQPGNYRFCLKYRLKGEPWVELPEPLSIDIPSPWWLSRTAKAGYLLLACAAAAGIFSIYHRRKSLETSLLIEQEKHKKDEELHQERLNFFTSVAHELRTPLTLIIDPLKHLMRKKDQAPEEERNTLELIYRNALHLHRLTDQILEFRRTETAKRRLRLVRADAAETAREVFHRFRQSMPRDCASFSFEQRTEDTRLLFDPEVLSSVLLNLLANAAKHTPATGEVRLILDKAERDGREYLAFSVKDNGIGIPAKELPHIFERYFRASNAPEGRGTGIGLAIVYNLAKLHRALLTADSRIGEGATFTFALDLHEEYPGEARTELPGEPQTGTEATAPDREGRHDGRPLLLIVEDNAEIRHYIRRTLEADFRILTAADGREGLEKARQEMPDLIVSDIMMPVMDGVELCKRLKGELETSHIPLILLTAKASEEDRAEGYDAGADSYLAKPLNSALLRRRIDNLIQSRRKLAESWQQNPLALPRREESRMSRLDRRFLEDLTAQVEAHLAEEEMDLKTIAENLHVSPSTLYRKTKALTGMNPKSFVLRTRMTCAARILAEEKTTVLEAMYRVGISTPAYFRKCFRETFGCLPSEYRHNKPGQG